MKNGVLILLLACAVLAGCKSTGSNDGKSGQVKIGLITNASADFWAYAEAGTAKAEKEFDDIEVIFRTSDGTTAKQKQIVDDMLAAGVEGIAISPTSAKNQVRMINDWSQDAKVICVDSDSPESNRICYLGTDNVAAGRKAGEMMKEALPNGGKIMVFAGIKDVQNVVERYQGVREGIAGSNIEVIDLRTDGGDATKARANAEDTLTAHPDLAGMVGLWGYNAPACLEAVRAADLLGKVQIVSFDEAPKTLEAIDAGEIFGTVAQDPYEFGYRSIVLLRDLMVVGKSPAEAGVPENLIIHVPTRVIRKGEGLEYKKQCDAWKASIK